MNFKNNLEFMFVMTLSISLVGCGNEETDGNITADEDTNNTENSTGNDREEVDEIEDNQAEVAEIEALVDFDPEAALYNFTMADENGERYDVSIISDNFQEEEMDYTWSAGFEGDIVLTGDLEFAISKEGEDAYYLQEVQEEAGYKDLTMNTSSSPPYVVENSPDLLVIDQFEITNYYFFRGYMILDNRLVKVEEATYDSEIERVEQDTFHYSNYDNTIAMYTHTKKILDNQQERLIEMEVWEESFHKEEEESTEETEYSMNSHLTSDNFLERLEKGYLLDSDLFLGQVVQNMEEELGAPDEVYEEYYGPGADIYAYENFAYLLSKEDSEIILIMAGTEVIGTANYDEVVQFFGEPESEGFNELTGNYDVNFKIDNRGLTFQFNDPDTDVFALEIN